MSFDFCFREDRSFFAVKNWRRWRLFIYYFLWHIFAFWCWQRFLWSPLQRCRILVAWWVVWWVVSIVARWCRCLLLVCWRNSYSLLESINCKMTTKSQKDFKGLSYFFNLSFASNAMLFIGSSANGNVSLKRFDYSTF